MKNQKGITLIALIITIIVMLILVGVSVTVALNGGLFSTAKDAAEETKTARDEELLMTEEGYIEAVANRMEVGTEVTIGETGENFYVIKDEGAKLVLLAKNNINTTSFKQADGNNPVPFVTGNTAYWTNAEEQAEYYNVDSVEAFEAWKEKWGYPKDLNKYSTCPEGSAISIAREYATETIGNGATGRLMTYEEAQPLSESEDQNIRKILYGNYTEGAYLDYWLGSAHSACDVWNVYGRGSFLSSIGFGLDGLYGVRPVIEISESLVTIVP